MRQFFELEIETETKIDTSELAAMMYRLLYEANMIVAPNGEEILPRLSLAGTYTRFAIEKIANEIANKMPVKTEIVCIDDLS